MNAVTTPDAYGVLTEPTTLTIQRVLPGPIERVWAYLTESDLRREQPTPFWDGFTRLKQEYDRRLPA